MILVRCCPVSVRVVILQRLYGIIVQVIFLIISAILLMNL